MVVLFSEQGNEQVPQLSEQGIVCLRCSSSRTPIYSNLVFAYAMILNIL